jgi:excinuclease ABC subunit C
MNIAQVKKLKIPSSPGIYMFLDGSGKPMYIGRATSLRDRVKSYFSADLISTRGPRIVDMVTKSKNLEWVELGSVLESVIQEGILIKRYQPIYNVDDKDDKSSLYIVITEEELPRVFLERVRDYDKKIADGKLDYSVKKLFGPYPHTGLIRDALKILRKLFPFRDKKADKSTYEKFYVEIGRSPRLENENSVTEYKKTIEYLITFFEGKKKQLLSDLKNDMDKYANDMKFEEANKIKRLINALDHINDIALLKRERNKSGLRIEAYDVAHISGAQRVGAMIVMNNGYIDKYEQRYFKLSTDTNDDIGGLTEILNRRLKHSEWKFPDLIVVDGGENQLKTAQKILSAGRYSIPVVAVTKDDRHKARLIIGDIVFAKKYKKEIVEVNAEAHRVSINYHRSRMRKHMI